MHTFREQRRNIKRDRQIDKQTDTHTQRRGRERDNCDIVVDRVNVR